MQKEILGGNRDTTLLKIIAGVCMIVDHMGVRLFNNMIEMRIIGRIAFPLYVWCLVVGACCTRNGYKYALRLLAVGVISQPFYMLGLNHAWNQLSVFATLLTGYLGILGMRERKYGSQYWAPLLALALACVVKMDYGWKGVLLILLMYMTRQDARGIAALMIAFCLFWGGNTIAVQSVLGYELSGGFWDTDIVKPLLRVQALALLALPLILWPRQKRTREPFRWAGYLVYPGHLLLLWIAQLLMGITTMEKSMQLLFPG